MLAKRWAGVILITCLGLAACQPKKTSVTRPPQPPAPKPATAQTLAALKASDPNALIGRVVYVLPDERLASVRDIPVQQFKEGDIVSFMGNEGYLTSGQVVRIVDGSLHVKWFTPPPGGRAPIVGDLCGRLVTLRTP